MGRVILNIPIIILVSCSGNDEFKNSSKLGPRSNLTKFVYESSTRTGKATSLDTGMLKIKCQKKGKQWVWIEQEQTCYQVEQNKNGNDFCAKNGNTWKFDEEKKACYKVTQDNNESNQDILLNSDICKLNFGEGFNCVYDGATKRVYAYIEALRAELLCDITIRGCENVEKNEPETKAKIADMQFDTSLLPDNVVVGSSLAKSATFEQLKCDAPKYLNKVEVGLSGIKLTCLDFENPQQEGSVFSSSKWRDNSANKKTECSNKYATVGSMVSINQGLSDVRLACANATNIATDIQNKLSQLGANSGAGLGTKTTKEELILEVDNGVSYSPVLNVSSARGQSLDGQINLSCVLDKRHLIFQGYVLGYSSTGQLVSLQGICVSALYFAQ